MSAEAALVVATVGLVAATIALAFYTRSLVREAKANRAEAENARREMEEARHLSVRPRLTFDPHVLGGKVGVLLIRNLGRGPALGVELSITFEGPGERRQWSEPSFAPGESYELKLPEPFLQDIGAAAEQPLAVRVEGKLDDLYGRRIEVAARLDVSEWLTRSAAAAERVAGRRKLPGD